MATQVQPSRDENTEVRDRRPGPLTTTVRVAPETKEALDQVKDARGYANLDDLIYELVRKELQPELGLGTLPPRSINIREAAQAISQIQEALRRIEVDLLVTDPQTGVLFNPVRGAKVEKNLKGTTTKRAHLVAEKFFADEDEAGVHVKLPHEGAWYATERDGDLPPAVIEHVKMQHERKDRRAPIHPRGRFFRDPEPADKPATGEVKKAPAK